MKELKRLELVGIIIFIIGLFTSIIEMYRIIQNTFHGGDTFLWIISLLGLFFGVIIYISAKD